MTVLIVVADEQRRHDLTRGLEASGYVVLAAACLAEAERLAHEARVHLCVSDTDLVVGAGTFLAASLRRSGATVLYTQPGLLAPPGLRTLWLDQAAPTPAVVRIVARLQPSRPNSDDSAT